MIFQLDQNKRWAVFSDCRKFRYALGREWNDDQSRMMLVGLNPSTATDIEDDPTIRRCIGFARDNGYGGIFMLNLFAYRSTDPKALKVLHKCEVVGVANDTTILSYVRKAGIIVAAWGSHGGLHGRDREVMALLGRDVKCFGTTRDGHPKHPLYLPKDTRLENFGA